MNERTQIMIKLIVSHIFLIMGLIIISVYNSKDEILLLSITQTVLLILYFTGYWEFFGMRFKNIFCAFIEFLLLTLFVNNILSGFGNPIIDYLFLLLAVVQVYLLVVLFKVIVVIFKNDIQSVEIEFPFRDGSFLVTDGGNSRISRLMNYHYYSRVHKKKKTNNSMLYATDIVKIINGNVNFLPLSNEGYPIFNEKIYSPIDGVIVKVENNIPDNKTFAGNYPYNTGNTVVIRKGDLFMLMGHLKYGSVIVKEGDSVKKNDLVANAGNSGWTERPHLHMQLIKSESDNYWFGEGVCIRYKNKNLYKNRVLKINS